METKKKEREEEEIEIEMVRYEIQLLGTLISGYNARRFLKTMLCFPKVKEEIDSLPGGGWERFQPLAALIRKYSYSPHMKIPRKSWKKDNLDDNDDNKSSVLYIRQKISLHNLTDIDIIGKDSLEKEGQKKNATLDFSEGYDLNEVLQSRLENIYGMNRHFSCLRLSYNDLIGKLDREILELQQSQLIQAACDRFIKLQIRYRTSKTKKSLGRSVKPSQNLPSQNVINEIEPILNDYKSSMYYPRISSWEEEE